MKKRLLAIFAAFAVAATMAIGFTACEDNTEDKGDGTHTEQPGDKDPENPDPENPNNPGGGDNTDPNNPSNPGGGDNTDPNNPNKPDPEKPDPEKPDKPDDGKDMVKMTEAEWKKAIEDTIAATSYSMTGTMDTVDYYIDHNGNSVVDRSGGNIGYDYDGVHGIRHIYSEQTYTDAYSEITWLDEYHELSGTNVTVYLRDSRDSNSWKLEAYNYGNVSEANKEFDHLGTMLNMLVGKTQQDDEIKALPDLLSVFTFDTESGVYSATLLTDDDLMNEVLVKLKFANGMVSYFEYELTDVTSEGQSYMHLVYLISGYNSTVVTIPEAAKQAAEENKS